MPKEKSKKPETGDDFVAVARRLECDPDMDKFDAKLRKIAKATAPKAPIKRAQKGRNANVK